MSELSTQQREWERIGDNAPRWRDILGLCNEVESLEDQVYLLEEVILQTMNDQHYYAVTDILRKRKKEGA